jgi:hypothetical protein
MRGIKVVVAVALLSTAMAIAEEKTVTLRFGKGDVGKVPAGWKADKTGKGEGSIWKVVADETAPSKTGYVLAQTAESPSSLFNLCVAADADYQNVKVSVGFKAMHGKRDQGGGIVWRYQDHNNYLLARMNPLEDNYRFYKVVAGKRIQLATKEGIKIAAGEWHILKIKQTSDAVECYLDGKKEMEAKCDAIEKPGKVGLWTKSDAQTYFDNLTIRGK